ncbi:hypothetical protein KY290_030372 [Solanum tuberosum]|uniref:Protein kinase domain-containing protein n=1 Tax=Solanum tuberosum TaxID=4113 RepID=A0ABQ7UND7_SOLTU|nr:hypothetical protein KY284_028486 [Solanum tuberosum]KAH0668252.1 hypothetical protein KY285_029458 [Solanum tuberosum]KAH0751140.1 hypothetical protein KY290_030372 [Solanum tuberosum]
MASRGRGRGRGGYGGNRLAKQVSFELFPEVENLGNAAGVTERIALAIWQANLQKFWNSSPYYLADESDVLKKTKGMDIERFSDSKSERAEPESPLEDFIKMDSNYVPAELAKGGRDVRRAPPGGVRWKQESDMRKLDLLEKLDQKSKGDDEKKKDGEDEDEDPEEKVGEEEEEFSDDGDYNQNLYDYDDDEDDYNMNEDNNGMIQFAMMPCIEGCLVEWFLLWNSLSLWGWYPVELVKVHESWPEPLENLSPEQAQPFSKTKTQHKPHSQPPQRTHPENIISQTVGNYKKDEENKNIAAQTFTFRELATATKNFRQECLIGEGGFGRVYKGHLDRTGQVIAVKQLDRNGLQGNREFLVEVLMLSLLHHNNLVNLIGYCADGEQRLLVYEYMQQGALEDHLFEVSADRSPLDWFTRMKIASNAAKGLEYLHHKANPPVIYRDLKSSNILLDKEYNAKLSDFGLAKLGPMGDNSHVSSRVMGTYGYCAPEYQRTGQLSVKSDVYSFGVVLLELITGKRAVDPTKNGHEQILVAWAEPIFKDTSRYSELADPLFKGDIPKRSFNQAVAIAAMCLQEDPTVRPSISDVVTALTFLWAESGKGFGSPVSPVSPSLPVSSSDNEESHEENKITERERAVAEAIEWGSNSRTQNERLP